MNRHIQGILGAISDLAKHAQAHPTDTGQLRGLRRRKVQAESLWIDAGCPGLVVTKGSSKPMPVGVAHPRQGTSGEDKDWTPVKLTLEVLSTSENAVRLTDGETSGWAPRSLLWSSDEGIPLVNLEVPEIDEMWVPEWIRKEKGWKS